MDEKELEKEQHRLQEVTKQIAQRIKKFEKRTGGRKEDVSFLRRTFWDDVKVNLDDAHEAAETYASMKQQAELLAERERSSLQAEQQLKALHRLKESPYFGRIDFTEEGEQETEQIYIGTSSFMDKNEEDFLIYDWRAPISSLYYDYGPGPVVYETPYGQMKGEMDKKRQYVIRNGEMKAVFDTGVTIGDEMLQQALGTNASSQMKSIVATIQREQNQIIRNEKDKILVVQGAAGSGKTSAALQRAAYLLYRFRGSMEAEQIVLFSPNPLFSSYVANVLPELGEENLQQTTFQEYAEQRLGKRFKLEGPFEQMEVSLKRLATPEYQTRMQSMEQKASLVFKEHIERYMHSLLTEGIVFRNITFQGRVIIPAERIKRYFYQLDPAIHLTNRIQVVSEWLLEELRTIEVEEREKEWVQEEIELLSQEDLVKAYQKLQENKRFSIETFDDFERETKLLSKLVVKRRFKPLKQKVKRKVFLNLRKIYINMMEQLPQEWQAITKQTVESFKQRKMFYEDITPFLYMEDCLKGRRAQPTVRHVFLDEAQDYSAFQFAYIRQLFPNSQFTLLGDMNQGLFNHTLSGKGVLSKADTASQSIGTISLLKSYRSTRQIVEFTKAFVEGGERIEPFNRDGDLPVLHSVKTVNEQQRKMIEQIELLKEKGHETIAVICKTMQETMDAFYMLLEYMDVHRIDSETAIMPKGVIVLPVYLAKGIEFDSVIIYNASETVYDKDEDRTFLYTGCTRAMHELHVFSLGSPTSIIDDVPKDKYKKE
ncbi:RNA polymerase recycling motor HelD [Bacillus tianshenii]|nr:RNA polymerase recycling motor HelD [Bacillus tianshenii]